MGRVLLLSFLILCSLMGLIAWVRSFPMLTHDPWHQAVAWLFVLMVVTWFTAELIYGGGDPNK